MFRQETALEMLKSQARRGGLTSGQIKLTEAQIADYKGLAHAHQQDVEKVEKRMSQLEEKVDTLDRKVDKMDTKLDQVLAALKKAGTISEKVRDILNNKVFLYLLITILCACFGVSVGEVGVFLFK